MPALLALLVCGVAAAGAGPARAHAVLLHSHPEDGAVLEAPPGSIELHFSEPVRPIAVRVLDAAGAPVAGGDGGEGGVVARDGLLELALPDGLPRGGYLVSYRVTSLDSHPVGGALAFSVGAPPPGGAAAPAPGAMAEADGERWRPIALLVRLAVYTGLAGGAGGALFLLLVADARRPAAAPSRAERRLIGACAGLGAGAAVLSIGVHGAHLADAPYADILAAGLWADTVPTWFGASALLAAAGLGLVALGCRRDAGDGGGGRAALGLGALAALASLPLSGHVTAAGPVWLTAPVLFLHGLAIAFWIGSLAPLLLRVAREGRAAAPLLERFSRVAVPAVAVLVLAGGLLAALQVRRPEALLATDYGRILLLKLGVVGLLLLLAAGNRLYLTPALRAGAGKRSAGRAVGWLRRTVGLEVAGAAVILAATAGLGLVPPPRAIAAHGGEEAPGGVVAVAVAAEEEAEEGYSTEIASGERTVRIEVVPGRPGPNAVRVTLAGPDGAPLQPLELDVTLAHPRAGIEPLARRAEPVGGGTAAEGYETEAVVLPVAGAWRVRVDALVTEFEKLTVTANVHLH
ncbi:MAG TPA: CopD family protein [Geminicoccaceae bacterium]|nr:CopD family protein [Geminicoccaceae bacterium]